MFTWPAIIVITTVIFIHTALAQVLGKMPTRSSTITPFKLPCPPYAPESFVPLELAFFYRNPLHSYGPPASHVPDPWRLMHLRRICLQISELASELAMREYVPVSLPHPQVSTATYEPQAFVPQQASKEQIEKTDKTDKELPEWWPTNADGSHISHVYRLIDEDQGSDIRCPEIDKAMSHKNACSLCVDTLRCNGLSASSAAGRDR